MRNYGIEVRIARFHNIFGPEGTWCGGREKAPAALCRKVAEAADGDVIEIWGDGKQTRSFLYIDECLEGVRRLVESEFTGPVNIGSEEMVSINQLAETIMDIAGKRLTIRHIPGPLGVRGRNSDNRLIREKLGWAPSARSAKALKKPTLGSPPKSRRPSRPTKLIGIARTNRLQWERFTSAGNLAHQAGKVANPAALQNQTSRCETGWRT